MPLIDRFERHCNLYSTESIGSGLRGPVPTDGGGHSGSSQIDIEGPCYLYPVGLIRSSLCLTRLSLKGPVLFTRPNRPIRPIFLTRSTRLAQALEDRFQGGFLAEGSVSRGCHSSALRVSINPMIERPCDLYSIESLAQTLEDRFQGMVEGSLAAAFAERRGKDVAQLGAMMQSVGRGAAVQKLFLAARTQPLQVHTSNDTPTTITASVARKPLRV